jgi:hypothetical protein
MRLRDGKPVCALCGARLNIPVWAKPERRLRTDPDSKRVRVLTLDDKEIHRCEVTSRR